MDIFESSKTPYKFDMLSEISSLMTRKNPDKFRYLGGGDFSLPPYTEEFFVLRQGDSDIELCLSWKPDPLVEDNIIVRYTARISYPMQKNIINLEKNTVLIPNKPMFISETETPQGKLDTRPVWVILKAVTAESNFAFPGLGGIGAKIQTREGYPFIIETLPFSSAQNAGLKPVMS